MPNAVAADRRSRSSVAERLPVALRKLQIGGIIRRERPNAHSRALLVPPQPRIARHIAASWPYGLHGASLLG